MTRWPHDSSVDPGLLLAAVIDASMSERWGYLDPGNDRMIRWHDFDGNLKQMAVTPRDIVERERAIKDWVRDPRTHDRRWMIGTWRFRRTR